MKREADESGIIVSWLVRVAVLLAVIGVVGFDLGSIVVNNVTLSSTAEEIAIAVSIDVSESTGSLFPDTRIYDMAVAEKEAEGIENVRVLRKGTEIDEEGNVHIRLRRRAETLVADLIGPLEKYTVATEAGQAGTN
jgi:alpha/beta superfamily hydrolase